MMERRAARWLLALALPALVGCSVLERARGNWWELDRGPSGQAPDPAATSQAVAQVYAARAVSWRGVFAVHTWIAVKPSGAPSYTRYEVIGWGVERGMPAVRVNRTGPDNTGTTPGGQPYTAADYNSAPGHANPAFSAGAAEPVSPQAESAAGSRPVSDPAACLGGAVNVARVEAERVRAEVQGAPGVQS